MNRDRVGKAQIREVVLLENHRAFFTASESDFAAQLFGINVCDFSDVAVKDAQVIIVSGLNHAVTDTQ